jgi:hypothetical protein
MAPWLDFSMWCSRHPSSQFWMVTFGLEIWTLVWLLLLARLLDKWMSFSSPFSTNLEGSWLIPIHNYEDYALVHTMGVLDTFMGRIPP